MLPTKVVVSAAAVLSLITASSATGNVAVYWGQGAGQGALSTFCDESSIDIIPLGFISGFPAQGNGYPIENFGNACGGSFYYGPGSNHSADQLYTQCPGVQEDIPYCQSKGKKILLSLGGASTGYSLTGQTDGEAFADFLWGAYGPKTQSWTGIRPLDRGSSNTSSVTIDIDGFDFDIEHTSTDNQAGYIACINRLRQHFASQPSKKYIISGAPQCPLPEQNMGLMIATSQFDILWIQFYNNKGCNARDWANSNPDYATTKTEVGNNFNYNKWKSTIQTGASKNAKIYIGLQGGPASNCTSAGYGDYITATEANNLISAYENDSQFGGIMLWEATTAKTNTCNCGKPYYEIVKDSMNGNAPFSKCPTVTSSAVSTKSSPSLSSPKTSKAPSTSSNTSKVLSLSSNASSVPTSTNHSRSALASSSSSKVSSVPTPTNHSRSALASSSKLSNTRSTLPHSILASTSLHSTKNTSTKGYPTTAPYRNSTASSRPIVTASSVVSYTTSTVYTTSVYTVTSCAPTVTNCPGKIGSVTTETISLYTTVCPVATFIPDLPSPPAYTLPIPTYTTSTVYTTKVYTVTSCAPTVTDCPARIGSVTTETVALYTTVCPVGSGPATVPQAVPHSFISVETIKIPVATSPTVMLPVTGLPPYPHPKSASKHGKHFGTDTAASYRPSATFAHGTTPARASGHLGDATSRVEQIKAQASGSSVSVPIPPASSGSSVAGSLIISWVVTLAVVVLGLVL